MTYDIHSFFFLSVRIKSVVLFIIFRTAFSMSSQIEMSSIFFFATNMEGFGMARTISCEMGIKKKRLPVTAGNLFIPTDSFYRLIANNSRPNL